MLTDVVFFISIEYILTNVVSLTWLVYFSIYFKNIPFPLNNKKSILLLTENELQTVWKTH